MPERFFVEAGALGAGEVVIEGPGAHHIARSLRMRVGEALVVVDDRGREHGTVLRAVSGERVEAAVRWTRPATGEPALQLTVIQALPRDGMEMCIDLLVAAGVAEVRPVVTERTVRRPDSDRVPRRLERWQAVAREAAQLCGRGIIPRVHPPLPLVEALAELPASTRLLACDFTASRPLAGLAADHGRLLCLCVGPEGGFAEAELAALVGAGAELVHLGPRVLRTRYAGAIAAAMVLAAAGELDQPLAPPPS